MVSQDGGVKVSVELVIPMNLLPPPDERLTLTLSPSGREKTTARRVRVGVGVRARKRRDPALPPFPPLEP